MGSSKTSPSNGSHEFLQTVVQDRTQENLFLKYIFKKHYSYYSIEAFYLRTPYDNC